ncbi:hypothetical protein GCM10011410_25520 [Hoyosella rhizosphaerae]|uniref:Uncharacterized protein n=1 Tax=Hoyosella rhizosphaerae TaxID=1755582 RepID=A0A916UGA3_9ACTN|nr:hypothetical protein GCM10011410_25520 [Hoyosella rhizosphaerae]
MLPVGPHCVVSRGRVYRLPDPVIGDRVSGLLRDPGKLSGFLAVLGEDLVALGRVDVRLRDVTVVVIKHAVVHDLAP